MNKSVINSLSYLNYKDQLLHVHGKPFDHYVKKHGSPIVVYSKQRIIENCKAIQKSFNKYYDKTKFYYAIKACYFKEIVHAIQAQNFGMEVLSGFEYKLAKKYGTQPSDVIFNGAGKTPDEISLMCKDRIKCINIDSMSEVMKIQKIGEASYVVVNIGIRVHPDIDVNGLFVNKGEKLGVDMNTAFAIASKVQNLSHVNLIGISAHLLSNRRDSEGHSKMLSAMVSFAKKLQSELDVQLDFIDIGGGIASHFLLEHDGFDMDGFAKDITQELQRLSYQPELIFEPGKFVVGGAACTISTITTKKVNDNKTWLISDINSNFLIPTRNAKFFVEPCEMKDNPKIVSVGDSIGSTAGVLVRDTSMDVDEGDCIVVLNCGAYTATMSEQFVFPRPKIIMVDGENEITLFHRETDEDILHDIERMSKK